MENKFLIIINSVVTEEKMELFCETVTSYYPGIKAGENLLVVKTDGLINSQDIYFKIATKTKNKFSFIVLPFTTWWGDVFVKTFDWLDENFPEDKLERINK